MDGGTDNRVQDTCRKAATLTAFQLKLESYRVMS